MKNEHYITAQKAVQRHVSACNTITEGISVYLVLVRTCHIVFQLTAKFKDSGGLCLPCVVLYLPFCLSAGSQILRQRPSLFILCCGIPALSFIWRSSSRTAASLYLFCIVLYLPCCLSCGGQIQGKRPSLYILCFVVPALSFIWRSISSTAAISVYLLLCCICFVVFQMINFYFYLGQVKLSYGWSCVGYMRKRMWECKMFTFIV